MPFPDREWTTKDILIVGAIVLCVGAGFAIIGYWSYKAWVWTLFELARYWGYL